MQAVFAILGLAHEARWNPDARMLQPQVRYELGRRMTTSPANTVTPSEDVTPDAVVQPTEQRGLVAEAKLGLPKDVTTWDRDIIQIQKYDDDLAGWWTASEHIPTHDIVVLVPITRAVKFVDRLTEGLLAGRWEFRRHVSVTGFFKQSGVKEFVTLKQEWGALSDENLSERLRQSKSIDIERLFTTYKATFVDSPPPLPYLLQIIWDNLFTSYAAQFSKEEGEEGKDYVALSLTLAKVAEDLQEYFGAKSTGPRSPEIPKPSWVRKAFDALVEFKLAERQDDQRYVIRYKRTRSDTLRKFGRLCFQLEQKQKARAETTAPFLPGLEPPASQS